MKKYSVIISGEVVVDARDEDEAERLVASAIAQLRGLNDDPDTTTHHLVQCLEVSSEDIVETT